MDEIRKQISEIVATVFRLSPEQVFAMPGDDSLAKIGMDSISCMDVVVQIEEAFGVDFYDEELLLDNLNSVDKLCGIVRKKLEPSLT
ncbi:acyl carrier protein [Xylanibacillus composti]|uniref:Carrier domain-containing protein n=1 Tax=Xylanibacillus composti TaxID=1572762 RepID=A0A8J4H0K7_9BACL|nr:acyl carrier protein [Xylanibacillus composti]GIQ67227.1 hypothetical protein XYCOK13_00510 [Xylanibacillus composti]